MGNQKPKPQPRQPTMDEILLDMRMAAKRFENDSKRAEKEKNQQMQKARQALQKGNEEGAKLFLANAATKQREQQQCLKMSHKMDALCIQIKGTTSSSKITDQISKITPFLMQQAQNIPVEKLVADMQNFEKAMDEIQATSSVVDNVINQNMGTDVAHDNAVDNMLNQLKQEQLNEIGNEMASNNGQLFNDLKNNNQPIYQQNQNQNFQNDIRKQ